MDKIFCDFLNKSLNSIEAQRIILQVDRKIRFELFIILFYATLNRNANEAFEVFKEAYCLTDNIYSQIQRSIFKFNLKLFLKDLQRQGVDIPKFMNPHEKCYYDQLPQNFTIYRGMSRKEYKSKNYGISWSLDKKTAEKYIFYDKNNSEKGGLAKKDINKKDILTIFNDGKDFEIIYLDNKSPFYDFVITRFNKIWNWKTKICLKYTN